MALDPASCMLIDDDILNFSLEGEDEDMEDGLSNPKTLSSSMDFSNPSSQHPDDCSGSFPEFAEEELEWLSNKDAFPGVETCFDILSNPSATATATGGAAALDRHSPVSVLETTASSSHSNSTSTLTSCCGSLQVPITYPVRKRSNRRPRRRRGGFPDLPNQQCWWPNQAHPKKQGLHPPPPPPRAPGGLGRRCQHCLAEKTPQWRAGPMGPKTLCNACGVRFKSGRLVPEYRPASSPTFSNMLHSNSHRKILEMRKQKVGGGGYGVG